MATEWWQKQNGKIARQIDFTAYWIGGSGVQHTMVFPVESPAAYDNDPNLFSRLSFENVKDMFDKCGIPVSHIIRGEITGSGGVRDCYVYAKDAKVPFAVIRPTVFCR